MRVGTLSVILVVAFWPVAAVVALVGAVILVFALIVAGPLLASLHRGAGPPFGDIKVPGESLTASVRAATKSGVIRKGEETRREIAGKITAEGTHPS